MSKSDSPSHNENRPGSPELPRTENGGRSIEEHLAQRPPVDNSALFDRLWSMAGRMRRKLDARFTLQPAASNRRFASYQSPDGSVRGSLETFSGPEIDWLVHSWLGNPGSGFTNIHLNTWLGPQVRVPHLALVLGTIPEVFFYFDLVPRVDMHCDLDYLDRYYAPFNQMFLDFTAHPAMRRFVSREIYMRQAISPCGLCFTCPPEDEILALLECSAHRLIDQWLAWVDEAAPVPEAERAALRARDERLRRNVAERDPANALAERLLGPELTRELVGVLWGTRAAR